MAAHSMDGESVTAKSLYIRTAVGAVGPYPAEALRRMVKAGVLPANGAVSPDGKSWQRADTIKGLFRNSTRSKSDRRKEKPASRTSEVFHASKEVKGLLSHIQHRQWLRYAVNRPLFAALFMAFSAAIFYLLVNVTGLAEAFTWKRMITTVALSVPALLGTFAIFTMGGSALAGKLLGVNDTERKFLALHLTRDNLRRLGFGRLLRNWIYRGDLLFAPEMISPEAYIHIFRTGKAPKTIADDVALWELLSGSLPYSLRPLCQPGETMRQVQTVENLPRWSNALEDVTDGYLLGGMLDHNYGEWADGFLARARKRLGLRVGYPVEFFLTYISYGEECEVLAACVYPRHQKSSKEEPESPSGVAA